MSHTPHELGEEFPSDIARIHELKLKDAHFARLADAYHAVNRAIHRAETGVEPTDPFTETGMRKERLKLKDEIAVVLAKAST